MNQSSKNFCFCTIALGAPYRAMASELANDLEKYSPGAKFYIYTDKPLDFKEHQNVVAFKHNQVGIQRCSNDRRLLIEKVLVDFPTAIHIDADTKILAPLPAEIDCPPGITGKNQELMTHIKKNRPHHLKTFEKVASKLDIPLEKTKWIGESLYIITRDNGKEKEFFKTWQLLATYVELKGMHGGDGNLMGLAAAKVGLSINKNKCWETMKENTKHLDASYYVKRSSWENFQRRLAYHYRLNKSRIEALKDFDFYYR